MSIPSSGSESNPPHEEAGSSGNGTHADCENFRQFFEGWLGEQDGHLQELLAVSRDASVGDQKEQEDRLRPIVDRILRHYEQYYLVKSASAKQDVLLMFSPTWTSSLEDALLWIGGWRPTMAFHLLYSKSGLQLEARLPDILRGLRSGDLGDLSPAQIARADEQQRQTIRKEMEISEKMAKLQESGADPTMVALSQATTGTALSEGEEESVDAALRGKKERLEAILEMADDLRMRTLRGVIQILRPLQTVHFLIAAAELHLRLREWGKIRDEMRTGQ
ncbi:hypothetical protein ACLOJK_013881 [Asimina triloba]